MKYPSHWQSHDRNLADIVRRSGRLAMRLAINGSGVPQESSSPSKQSYLDKLAYPYVMLRFGRATLQYRNKHAIKAVDAVRQENPDVALTLLWGADHLPGFGKALTKRNYRFVKTLWLKAY